MDLEPGTRIADDLPHAGFHGGDLIPLWHNCFTLLRGAQWPLTVRRPSGTGLLTADCSANLTATSCTKLIRQKIVDPVRHQEGIVRDSAGSMASRMTFRNPYTMLSCLHVDAPPCSGRYWLAMRFQAGSPGIGVKCLHLYPQERLRPGMLEQSTLLFGQGVPESRRSMTAALPCGASSHLSASRIRGDHSRMSTSVAGWYHESLWVRCPDGLPGSEKPRPRT